MKRYDTLPEGLRGVYLRVMRSLGNQLTARGTSGIRSAEELGFLAERVGRIPREGDLGIFSIAKSYRWVFERIAEDDFRSYVVSKRLLQTRVVGFDGVVASVDVLDLSGFDESEEVDDSVSGCDVDDGFEDVETIEDTDTDEDEDEDGLDFEDVEEEEDNSLDFEDVEEEEDNSLDFEDVEEDEDEDGLDFEDVEEDEDEDGLDFEDVEEEEEDEDEDEDGLDFEDVEEEDEDEDGLDFEDVEEDEDEDNSLDFEDVEEDEDENSLDFEDVDEDEDNSLDFEDDDAEDASNSQSSRTVGTSSRGDTRRRPAAQQAPTPGIRKDWSRIRGVEGNESMETVLSGVESLFSKLRGRRS